MERVHCRDRAEQLRLRPLDDDDHDESRIAGGYEACERRDVRIVEVATVVAFLLSDDASYATGTFIDVSGGR